MIFIPYWLPRTSKTARKHRRHCEARSNLILHDGLQNKKIASYLAKTMVVFFSCTIWVAVNTRIRI